MQTLQNPVENEDYNGQPDGAVAIFESGAGIARRRAIKTGANKKPLPLARVFIAIDFLVIPHVLFEIADLVFDTI